MKHYTENGMWWFQLWPFRLALNEGGRYAAFNFYVGGIYKLFVYISIRPFGRWWKCYILRMRET
jgi:hypothetical protein